ncbi:helix-turn-helix domain-containing protein [Paenibacillus sp. J2TS4]|uniref:helix-turn-helix domain-containing protein n=1 Tax=Paenibacillus sp. J2TS4 TaxID=2807194 RepID=UPI001BCEC0D4|nr:helix-turn-helix domain-containing protein [Paenibacillus sp. J2TS4]
MFRSKRSVMYAWIVSYAVIFFIPVIVSASIYPFTRSMLEREIHDANQSMLNQVQYAIDDRLRDIQKIANELATKPAIRGLPYLTLDTDKALQYNAVMQYLRGYKMTNSFLDDIYIVLGDQSGAISYDTFLPYDLFNKRLHGDESWSVEQWEELLSQPHYGDFETVCRPHGEQNVCEAVVLVQSLPTLNQNSLFGQLVLVMDGSNFLEPIRNLQWVEGAQLLILDDSYRVVAATSEIHEVTDDPRVYELSGNFHAAYNERDWTVSHVKSDILGWTYLSFVPTQAIEEKLNYIRNLTVAGLALSFTLGGLLTYFFIRRNYHPLNRLIRGIADHDGRSFDKRTNEFEWIEQAIAQSALDKKQIHQIMHRQEDLLKTNDLVQWLEGHWMDQEWVSECFADHLFDGHLFGIMILQVNEEKMAYQVPAKEHGLAKEMRLARFILSNTAKDIVSAHYGVIGTEANGNLVLIIQFHGDAEEIRQKMNGIAKEIRTFIDEKYRIPFTMAVSNMKSDLLSLPVAYREALDTIEYNLILGISGISFYGNMINSDNMQSEDWVHFSSLRTGRKLINYVKIGDVNQAKEALGEMFELHSSSAPLSVQTVKLMKLNLINTMMNTLYEISPFIDESLLQQLNPVRRLFNCQQIAEIKEEMNEILERLCAYVNEQRKEDTRELQEEVTAFLEENYRDTGLSVAAMGAHFGMTPTYLSRLFKEQTGGGLLDYILRFRLEKAKALLRHSEQNVNQIALQVGFASTNTFIRAFKKYEGITPGKYRE